MRKPLTVLIVATLVLAIVQPLAASEFYAIVWNLTGVKHPEAHLDVSGDKSQLRPGTDILFQVFNVDGLQLSDFTLQLNARGFVSTAFAAPGIANLFDLSLGPMLIRVQVPSGANNEYASLRQTLGNEAIVVGIPPLYRQNGSPDAVGTLFPVTLGDFSRAALLVANVSGADVVVDVFVGTKGPDGTGKYSIRVKPNASGILQITDPADAQSHLVMSSTGLIVAQLVVDTGKQVHEVTVIPA